MYVSIRDDTLLATGFDDIADGLKYYGIQGVELAVKRDFQVRSVNPGGGNAFLDLSDCIDVAELVMGAEEAEVRISGFLLANDFNATDRKKELDWIVHVVEVAAKLSVPVVRIDAIMSGERDLPLEKRAEIFAAGVTEVIQRTEGVPVDLGIENHGFQGNDPDFLDELMCHVGHRRLGMTLDTGNFYWAGHPLEKVYDILEHLAPVTKHTHIKNINYPAEIRETQRTLGFEYDKYVSPIMDGDIDHARVIEILKEYGYDRDLCLEDESLGKYDIEGRRTNIQAAVAYFNGLL